MSYEKVAKMSTPKEPDCCTWTTLLPFIEAEIPRTEQAIMQFYRELAPEDAAAIAPRWQSKLQVLHWYLPLAREMLRRPAVQSVSPMLSLLTIRLFYEMDPKDEFAWIQAIAEDRFSLSRVPNHVQKKDGEDICQEAQPTMRHKPHGVYSKDHDRLDYFVSREEVKSAYEALTHLMENSQGRLARREITLFDTLVVHLV